MLLYRELELGDPGLSMLLGEVSLTSSCCESYSVLSNSSPNYPLISFCLRLLGVL